MAREEARRPPHAGVTGPVVFIRWLRLQGEELARESGPLTGGLVPGSRLRTPAVLAALVAACDGTGLSPRTPVRFTQNPWGKPGFAEPSTPHFNISHSADLVLVAVSRDVELGVDVERIRHIPEAAVIARSRLGDDRMHLESDSFIKAWCRHEAGLKCLGTGLAEDPPTGGDLAAITTTDLVAPAGFKAALAVRGELAPRIQTVRLTLEEEVS